ncbi:MAG: YiaA/YiaB family inner membrane protein [Actinomycetota bacterium]|nr:YiaA/YiaB family inner membrane protein [Actinomycetota bacterium]
MSPSNDMPQTPTTAAFYLQAVIAFAVSLGTAVIGILYLPIDPWQRGFLAITLLFLTSSTFTLAKVVRDRQEQTTVRARVDEARMDKLIAEHDPFKNVS